MVKIRKILETELVGGTQSTDVYPVTSVKAVYDENNVRLDTILKPATKEAAGLMSPEDKKILMTNFLKVKEVKLINLLLLPMMIVIIKL